MKVSLLRSLDGSATGNGEPSQCDDSDIPNLRWGTYYRLPADLPKMEQLLSNAWRDHIRQGGSDLCLSEKPQLVHWYRNCEQPNLLLLIYACKDKNAYMRVVEKQSSGDTHLQQNYKSLESFPIQVGNEYQKLVPDETFKETLIDNVQDEIALQVVNGTSLCDQPRLGDDANIEEKEENGFQYYK